MQKPVLTTLFLVLACLSQSIHAQVPIFVKDINPGPGDSFPFHAAELANGRVLFAADNGTQGRELWVTDGSGAGTTLVKDINPGPAVGLGNHLYPKGDSVFFFGNDGVNGLEPWVSDGTAAGTVMIKDVNPGAGSGGSIKFVRVGNTMFFAGDDGVNGTELWKTDGSAAGTQMVLDIYPGASSMPSDLIVFNGQLYFRALSPTAGSELWTSDGTANGTVMVKDFYGPTLGLLPIPLFVLGNELLIEGAGANGNFQLFKTDGTANGTVPVKEICPGCNSSAISFTELNGTAYFSAVDTGGREFWKTDGTTAGTQKVKEVGPGSFSGDVGLIGTYNNALYFTGTDGANGRELWKSDGTASGTNLFMDINPGPGNSYYNTPIPYNGLFFFTAEEPIAGRELWQTDGTAAGTRLVADIAPGLGVSSSAYRVIGADYLYFAASDSLHGLELWRLDFCYPGMLSANADTLCNGGPVNLAFSGSDTSLQLTLQQQVGGTWQTFATYPAGTGGTTLIPTQSTDYRLITVCGQDTGFSNTLSIVVDSGTVPNIASVNPLCSSASPIQLSANPSGGTWAGNGVSGNMFDPATAGIGQTLVTYEYINGNGCSGTDSIQITIHPDPVLTLTPLPPMCSPGPDQTLSALPSGGVWSTSSPAISGNTFSPTIAGPGIHWIYYTYMDSVGCTSTDSVPAEVSPCVGIASPWMDQITLFPNPVDEVLKLRFSKSESIYSWKIFDAMGRLVMADSRGAKGAGEIGIPVTNLAAGNYYIQLETENSTGSLPFKKH